MLFVCGKVVTLFGVGVRVREYKVSRLVFWQNGEEKKDASYKEPDFHMKLFFVDLFVDV